MGLLIDLVLYLGVGAVAGLLAGLLGIGGGLIMVPTLYLTLPLLGIDATLAMHMAVGTSLAVMVVTAMDATYSHARRGDVLWPEVRKVAPPVAMAALVAALLASHIPHHFLRGFFMGLLVLVILRALLKRDFASQHELKEFVPPSRLVGTAFGLFLGSVCALLGVGGSFLTVPFYRRLKLPMVNTASLSAALAVPLAICGATGYAVTGWSTPGLPEGSTGFIYWPAMAGLTVGSLVGVPLGAKLSHRLPDRLTSLLFLALLILSLILMAI